MSKKVEVFSIRALHMIDNGELEADFDSQLRRLVADCLERPAIDKNRVLRIELKITPAPASTGVCDDVFVECSTTSKCPNRPVRPYRMTANVKGALKFQPSEPLEPNETDEGDDS